MSKTEMIERSDRTREWWLNGGLHREDGPAVEHPDGTREWWLKGKLHREDGPAVERPDGTREWWLNDKLHREDGPAVERPDGTREWWLNGVSVDIIDVLASTDTGVLFMTLVDSMPPSMRAALVQYVNRVMHDSRDN